MFKRPTSATHRINRRVTLLILVSIIMLLVSAAALIQLFSSKSLAPAVSGSTEPAVNSILAFDAAKAPDWKQGPRNESSMALFYQPSDCFISLAQKSGQIDEADQIAKAVATMQSQGNIGVATNAVQLELKTANSSLPYTLHQLRSGGGNSDYYQFQQIGYVREDNGYVAISGYCKEGKDLNAGIDALKAVSFKN